MTELLRIEGLTVAPVAAPDRLLVKNVSLALESGRTTCIVGESGSGKSLTALSVMGLLSSQLKRTHGKVIFQGRDLTALSNEQMRDIRGKNIGMIFQEPMTSLNPVLTVGYQIGESLTVHLGLKGQALKTRVAGLLEQVGIPPERANSYPDELSGGQRQRVMIAMSIACEPAMLIADEPTTALDVTVQAQILKLLDELKRRMNMGMLFITHDFGVVADIADNVVVMFRGEIVESGPVAQVLGSPQHPYTQALLACVPDAEGLKPLKPIDYAWLNNGLENEVNA
ncbi:MAG TPA: ABC transporter ATP-binding protein [Methylophilaceae bacterium]|nr:ABC transporter ATP-binding protein [Methylophilaceae bacterium]